MAETTKITEVPQAVEKLVELFGRNIETYRGGRYNETQVRREFIDPFFAALGWDVENRSGCAEAYKDVIHEDAIKVGGVTKAPDYCFRIGGTRKFFVEAKKPAVNLAQDASPAYQLRRYAWSAKLPLSILTDFEEFAVYDCRVRPRQGDKPSVARVMYFKYDQYIENWPQIAAVFAKKAVLQGSFDKYAAGKKKRGTAEVDAEFLKEIENWRTTLARNIALRNAGQKLGVRDINFAVQRTIDRIIFLRMCEDRGVESYGSLQALIGGDNVYSRLMQLFRVADDRYNSGLFHFDDEKGRDHAPDTLTPGLAIDDKVLKDIFRALYYPQSPYEFSVLPADILGNVYEQFLGKVIHLSPTGRASVEEKPEVKKAGGVYYTPRYIVDYIVKHTIGKLIAGKTPAQIKKLRFLDPACGSGSFVVGAYKFLLDYHRDWYIDEKNGGPGKHTKEIYQGAGGQWYLTSAVKKSILLNNIYGVDIDPQAVEVTKLNLLLCALENENQNTIGQLALIHQRALPDLVNNIKCGNSLIGPDFYNGKQLSLFNEETQYKINAFDWKEEFPEAFKSKKPGFDAVIGNPPYIRIQNMKETQPEAVDYFSRYYRAAQKGNYDIYVVFIEKGLSRLNKSGRLGYICPHKFFNAKYGEAIRAHLSEGKHLSEIVHFADQQVFANATTYTCLLFLDKSPKKKVNVTKIADISAWRNEGEKMEGDIPTTAISSDEWNFLIGKSAVVSEKLKKVPLKLKDVATRLFQGSITSADTIYLFKEYENHNTKKLSRVFSKEAGDWITIENSLLKSVVRSGNIGRYQATPTALVLFPYKIRCEKATLISQKEMEQDYPHAWKYLLRNRKKLEQREKGKFKDSSWYRFGRHQNLGMWERPKLLVPYMITNLSTYLDLSDNYYFINVTTGGYGITVDEDTWNLTYLCGLLNSRVLDFYFKQISTHFHGGYFAANKQYIEQLPIRKIDFSNVTDKAAHDRMVELVEGMLGLHRRLADARTPQSQELVQRQITATDKQIDNLVYELYSLTEEEIAIVESNA